VALAQEQGVPLLTADRQILRAFPKLAISLDKFVASRT
jgi:predicted nucleic acid-binding protein